MCKEQVNVLKIKIREKRGHTMLEEEPTLWKKLKKKKIAKLEAQNDLSEMPLT